MARAAKRAKRARQLRKAGALTRNLTLRSSNAGCFGVRGQLKAIRADAAKATCRLSRGQTSATTMTHAQVTGAKRIDPTFRQTSCVGVGNRSLGKCSGPRTCRPRFKVQLPGSAASRGRGAALQPLRAHVAAVGLERTVCQAPHHPRWHDDGPLGSGTADGGFLGRTDRRLNKNKNKKREREGEGGRRERRERRGENRRGRGGGGRRGRGERERGRERFWLEPRAQTAAHLSQGIPCLRGPTCPHLRRRRCLFFH